MKTELKAKYLQHLLKNKKDKSAGFTLIELLVVIIIIGILAAIALPSFLSQASKAKQSEAKNAISSINSGQTAFRTESTKFAGTMAELALGLPTGTDNYEYTIVGGADTTTTTAKAKDTALKYYSGGTGKYTDATTSQSIVASVICEAKDPGTGTPVAPAVTTAAAPACDTASTKKL